MCPDAPIERDAKSPLAISDDLTGTRVILWEMILTHKKSDHKSRERSLVITKLEEAMMWCSAAQREE